jgi:acyl-CoA thioesterase
MSDTPAAAADLTADTTVTPFTKAPGWYTASLPDSWDFVTPSGGVLMTVALRAMADALGDDTLRPVSATTLFMSPVPNGPLQIRVEVLRRGGSAAQLRAALSSTSVPGPGLEVSATFARPRSGPEFLAARRPDLPAPDDCESTRRVRLQHWEPPRIFDNIDVRYPPGNRWWEPDFTPSDDARAARWFRYLVPQTDTGAAGGELHWFALPPIMDTMPPAVRTYLGPSEPFDAPSLDLTVHFCEPTTAEWLLVSAYARYAADGYATAEVEVWGGDRLVAYGTQTMILLTPRARGAS